MVAEHRGDLEQPLCPCPLSPLGLTLRLYQVKPGLKDPHLAPKCAQNVGSPSTTAGHMQETFDPLLQVLQPSQDDILKLLYELKTAAKAFQRRSMLQMSTWM